MVQGDNTLGLNQPAKALNAVIVARPLVYIGPSGSDLAAKASVSLRHGDALGLVAALRDYKNNPDKRCQDGVALTNAYAAQAPQGQLVQWLGVIDAVLTK